MNEDHMATTYDDGCDMMANGEAAQWIILTSALSNMNELYGADVVNKIGCFAIPGDDENNVGLTIWEPNAMYLNKNSEAKDAAEALMQFWISKAGLDTLAAAEPPVGPYVVKNYDLPDDVYTAVKDMNGYVASGQNGTALEFKTAVKGANCASICQELASGQTTAEEAAAKYDEDCKKQAVQLGLDWN
jgi:raffinose/stachyose/melibiose transport system substrate-binding protein